jgi:tRNA (guanosine-2'-O-)-methyltransferase
VSAALLVYTLTHRLHEMTNVDWHLSEEEKEEVRLEWARRTLNRIRQYERKFAELHPELF